MIKIIAHRGYHNSIFKENTYVAIFKALNDPKVYGIEIDIRLTKDKKIVIIHDKDISRTSNGTGIVENMTLKELQRYNYGTKNVYQTIPTLDKILSFNINKLILLDIKNLGNEKELANHLNKLITKNSRKIYFMSFNEKVLKLIRKDIPKGHLKVIGYNKKYDFIPVDYKLGNIKSKKEIFFYTIKNNNSIKEISNNDAYYICDNLDNIL